MNPGETDLDLREDGVAPPRIVGEVALVVTEADGGASRSVAILNLVLVLVQRREVVELERFVAGSTRDAGSAHALAAVLIAQGTDRSTEVASAIYQSIHPH